MRRGSDVTCIDQNAATDKRFRYSVGDIADKREVRNVIGWFRLDQNSNSASRYTTVDLPPIQWVAQGTHQDACVYVCVDLEPTKNGTVDGKQRWRA